MAVAAQRHSLSKINSVIKPRQGTRSLTRKRLWIALYTSISDTGTILRPFSSSPSFCLHSLIRPSNRCLSLAPRTAPLPTMSLKGPVEGPSLGFDFSNYARNQHLGQTMGGLPKGEQSLNMSHCDTVTSDPRI